MFAHSVLAEYHATYSVVYQESARKRIGLAERLRRFCPSRSSGGATCPT